MNALLRGFYARISSGLVLVCWPWFGARSRERRGWHGDEIKRALARKYGCRIWVHAVSVGEVDVALHLIEACHHEDPSVEFVLTTVTRDGYRLAARRNLPQVHLSYAPLDYSGAVRRSFQTFAPDLLVLVEIEIWPNQLWEAKRRGIPVAVVNGRLPDDDLKKYRWGSWFMRDVFHVLSLVCVQTREDSEGFREMGVLPDRIRVTGSVKIDSALAKADHPRISGPLWDSIAKRTVLIGASTHAGEEEILFEITSRARTEFAELLLIIAPRHIDRVDQLLSAAEKSGLPALRWSDASTRQEGIADNVSVVVIDTIGDLARLFPLARVVIVGKSLTAKGGQNPIEPAAASRAVIFGPHMQNFASITRLLLQNRGAVQVANVSELEVVILGLLRDPGAAAALGRAARETVESESGATERTLRLLANLSIDL